MIAAIKPRNNVDVVQINHINDETFKYLINQIYDIMVDYTRMHKKYLTKNNPIQIGNISFWFETDSATNESRISFSRSVDSWNEKDIIRDLEQHFYDLHFNGISS